MTPVTADYLERRLAEEFGQVRAEMRDESGSVRQGIASVRIELGREIASVRQEMAAGFGGLRAEMADRNAELLKWLLAFFVAQTAAIATLMTLFR